MGKVALVTDTAASLSEELASRYEVNIAPFIIIKEGKEYRDGVDITTAEVLSQFDDWEEHTTTTGVSIDDCLNLCRRIAERSSDILWLTVTTAMSPTTLVVAQRVAEMAREELPGVHIEVFNCLNMGAGQGLIALATAQAAAEGKDLAQVLAIAKKASAETKMLFLFDTLKYMVRRGRISKFAGWMGSILDVKPMTHVVNGEFRPLERSRGKHKALRRMVELMEKEVAGKRVRVFINHVGVPEEAKWLEHEVASKFDCVEVFVTELSPLIAIHSAPGAVGFAFRPEDIEG
jgi:DegV family protein with EDD domain